MLNYLNNPFSFASSGTRSAAKLVGEITQKANHFTINSTKLDDKILILVSNLILKVAIFNERYAYKVFLLNNLGHLVGKVPQIRNFSNYHIINKINVVVVMANLVIPVINYRAALITNCLRSILNSFSLAYLNGEENQKLYLSYGSANILLLITLIAPSPQLYVVSTVTSIVFNSYIAYRSHKEEIEIFDSNTKKYCLISTEYILPSVLLSLQHRNLFKSLL